MMTDPKLTRKLEVFVRQFSDGIDSGEFQARLWDADTPIVSVASGKPLTGEELVRTLGFANED